MKAIIIFAIPVFLVVFLISTSFSFEKKEVVANPNYDIIKNDINSERIKLATLYKSATTEEGGFEHIIPQLVLTNV